MVKLQFNYFKAMFHFHSPCKGQKTRDFLTFSGSIETEHWFEIVEISAGF